MNNDPIFGKKKHRKTSYGGKGPDKLGIMVEEMLQELIVSCFVGTGTLLKLMFSKWFPVVWGCFGYLAYYLYYFAGSGQIILWIGEIEPNYITTEENLEFLWDLPLYYHLIVIYILTFIPIVYLLGCITRFQKKKYEKLFKKIGLTNGLKETPKLLRVEKLDQHRKSYVFQANGIGTHGFEAKKDGLEAVFGTRIESISNGKDKSEVIMTLTTSDIPNAVDYRRLKNLSKLPKECFYLGATDHGVLTQKLTDLPHMLIAGATGSGKSIFFKQALMGLLESCDHVQMYLIDLKNGLEMTDFSKCPNVKIIKNIDDALIVLKQAEKEMKERFTYLEKNNFKSILPARDKKDRIIIAVDESSVLYMERSKFDANYESGIEARRLADSIAKLARAASIHLLLATQKLDKSVIPTSVSENISGRMAFRTNSLQGSLLVLGTKEAMELPEIPGRGIWSFGVKKITVQAPYINEKTIVGQCEQIATEFQTGERRCFNPLLGEEETAEHEETSESFFSGLKEEIDGTQTQEDDA